MKINYNPFLKNGKNDTYFLNQIKIFLYHHKIFYKNLQLVFYVELILKMNILQK